MKKFFYGAIFLFFLNTCTPTNRSDPYGLKLDMSERKEIGEELKRMSENYNKVIKEQQR